MEYVDNSVSASKGRRPAYEQMLDDIRAGAVQAVVAWDLDRLHRRPAELESFITLADAKHLALATIGGDADLSTDNGRLFARIKGAVARSEVERKSARQKAAALQRAEAGKAWGPRAFGYTEDHTGLVPTEAAAVAKAYRDVLAGASLGSVAKEWNTAELLTTKGNQWRSAQVRQMLINARYAGLRSYRGEIVGPAAWEAIVDEDTWRSVQTILADPGRRRGATRGRKHLLTGLVVCGKCGQTMGSGVVGSGALVYSCKRCMSNSRNMAKVDEVVLKVVLGRLAQPDAADLTIDHQRADLTGLRDQAAALRARLEALAVDYADGLMDGQQVRVASARIKDKLAEIEPLITDAHSARVFDGVTGPGVSEAWEVISLDRRRAIIDALVSVTVEPAGRGRVFNPELVKISWRR